MSRTVGEIRADLTAMAPLAENGDVTAAGLARHFGVRAQERWIKGLESPEPLTGEQVSVMVAEFAACHALEALAKNCSPEFADDVACQARDAICDGGEIGPWLFDHLGEETVNRVSELTRELIKAQAVKADA